MTLDKLLSPTLLAIVAISLTTGCTLTGDIASLDSQANTTPSAAIKKVPDYVGVPQDSQSTPLDTLFADKTTDTGDAIESIKIVAQPSQGTVVISGNSIVFTPNLGFTGKDSFTYEITGKSGTKSTGSIRLEVRKNHTWSGAGSDSLWSNADNWIGGVPQSTDVAYFDDACSKCDALIDGQQTALGLTTAANFTGSISLGNQIALDSQLSLGTSGLVFQAGTLNLGKGKLSTETDASFTAGTINGQDGVFTTGRNLTLAAPTMLNASNSTFEFNSSSGGTISADPYNFGNVSFSHDSNSKTITGNLNVQKKLAFNVAWSSVNTGTINARGDIEVTSLDSCCGTAKVKIIGNTDQLISGTNQGFLPNLEIASTGGLVTFKNTVRIRKDMTYTSGSVQFNSATYGPSTIDFSGSGVGGTITVPSSLRFANVSFTHDSSSKTLSGTLTVDGSLTFNVTFVSINGGTIEASGDVNLTKMTASGSAMLLKLVGTNNQLITGTANGVVPNLEIAKTGGVATVNGTMAVSKNLTYTSGSIDFLNPTYGTGTLLITGASTGGTITVPGSLALGHVSFTHDSSSKTLSGIMSVYGALTFNVTFVGITGGEIDAYGDVTVTKMSGGTVLLALVGASNQLISSTTVGNIGHLSINKTGGVATFSGSLGVQRNFTYTAGNVDMNNVTYGRATTRFVGASTGGSLTPGSIQFGDVSFLHDSSSKSMTGTMSVKGDLTVNTTFVWVTGGTINVEGNVTITKTGGSPAAVGATQVAMIGANNQGLSQVAGQIFPGKKLTINKSGGNVSLSTAVSLSTSQDLAVTTTGSVLQGGFSLNGTGTFTCNSGTVTKAGGTLWTSGTTSNIGCTIN